MILTPALIMAFVTIALWIVLDTLFYSGILPGWTLSEGILKNVALRPWLWRSAMLMIMAFLFWHLAIVKP